MSLQLIVGFRESDNGCDFEVDGVQVVVLLVLLDAVTGRLLWVTFVDSCDSCERLQCIAS